MHILSLSNNSHDHAVALFKDYEVLVALQRERVSRKKGHGSCIDLDDPGM